MVTTTKARSFLDLEVYQLAKDLAVDLSQRTKKFPREETYRIIDQLLRAAYSIGANIAEGYGRFHRKELIKFLYNARGSLMEVHHFLVVSKEVGYLSEAELKNYENEINKLGVKLNNFIKSISQLVRDN